MPYLRLLKEDGSEESRIPVPPGKPFTIGRESSAACRVPDLRMSRMHCEVTVSGGVAIVTDLGSMNGTYVNGKRIASTALKDGDVIQAGYTTFEYREGDGSAEPVGEPAAPPAQEQRAEPAREAPEPGADEPGEPIVLNAEPGAPQADSAEPADEEGLIILDESHAAPEPGSGDVWNGIVLDEEPAGAEAAESAEPRPAIDPAAIAARLRITEDRPERPLRRGEKICSSCRQPVTAKELKSGAATDIHGQVCCPRCIEADPLLGKTVAGYRFDAKLGAGSWFISYKAQQLSMARSVVLRVLRREIAADRELITQFLAAVKRGGQISHPNLARIYDIGRAEHLCYVCLEFVDGRNLLQRTAQKGGRGDVADLADIILRVAGAVEIAHRRNVHHRDIRPANIILNDERVPKLVGLGFAKSITDASASGAVNVRYSADILHYWAPECLIEPGRATAQVDVYALGASLYSVLAGHPPFRADAPAGLVSRILKQRPKPLDALRGDVPHRVSAVVARAMARSPEDRYAGCHDFADDLEDALR
ncbi:MAG: protein kinase [Planctomycetota bacterium]